MRLFSPDSGVSSDLTPGLIWPGSRISSRLTPDLTLPVSGISCDLISADSVGFVWPSSGSHLVYLRVSSRLTPGFASPHLVSTFCLASRSFLASAQDFAGGLGLRSGLALSYLARSSLPFRSHRKVSLPPHLKLSLASASHLCLTSESAIPLPRLSPAGPVKESSPEVQEGSLAAAKTEGALWPASQGLPSASIMAPPAGKEGQSSSGDVETQKCLESQSPKGVKKAEVESDQEQNLVPLSQLTPYMSCDICKGYLIDAATITECLHSFCKSCIIKHFEHSKRCPKCNTVVHEAKPHNSLRLDPQLQNIVYKLVAGLEEKEKKQKREFYKGNCPETPKPAAVLQPGHSSKGSTKKVVK